MAFLKIMRHPFKDERTVATDFDTMMFLQLEYLTDEMEKARDDYKKGLEELNKNIAELKKLVQG